MSIKINYSKKAPGNTSANLILFSNEDYKKVGAQIISKPKEIFSKA